MGHQYESLRNDLVDMGYSETFGAESASLIARLFADVCSYKEQCSDARNKLRAVLQEKQEKDAMAEAYRQANAKAIMEVNALHQNMMYFKDDHLRKVKELEGLLHKAEEHRRKCEFVKAECQKRVSLLEKESQLKSDRILQLQSRASAQAIIHVTEATKAAPSHRAQGMEVTSLLTRQQGSTGGGHATTPRHPRDAREIDVLRLADTRIHQLQDERQQLKESLHQSRATLELLQQRVEARDREIERLSRLLRDGIPYKALSENGKCSCKLQEEAAPDPKVTLPADQAPCPEPRKAVAALKPAKHVRKVNFGHLQRKAEPLGKDLKQTKNKRLASSGGEDASCAENAKFREVLEALRLEKRTLQERVQQMASNERELLREMERLCKEQHRDPAPKDPECDGLQALVRSLERERDHYKEELVQLHQTLESGNLRPKNAAPTSTRGISESQQTLPKERRPGPVPTENSSEGPPWLQEEATRLSALVGELSEHRDQLRVERDRQAKQLAALQEEIRKRDREMKNTELTCKATEDHVDNLQGSIRAREQELARLKLRIQELDDDARSAHAEILRLVRENGQLRDNLTLVAKEHQNMAADLDNAVQQREEFKIQIQEYVTEVARVQELLQLKLGATSARNTDALPRTLLGPGKDGPARAVWVSGGSQRRPAGADGTEPGQAQQRPSRASTSAGTDGSVRGHDGQTGGTAEDPRGFHVFVGGSPSAQRRRQTKAARRAAAEHRAAFKAGRTAERTTKAAGGGASHQPLDVRSSAEARGRPLPRSQRGGHCSVGRFRPGEPSLGVERAPLPRRPQSPTTLGRARRRQGAATSGSCQQGGAGRRKQSPQDQTGRI
ncbi:centrosomal protein of 135 kDa [Ixodes scapularis]